MSATLATVDALLKEVYEDGPREQINQDVVALRRIEKSSEGVTNEVGGRYVTFPVHTRRNSGTGARREMEALPTAGRQGHVAARVPLRYQYGAVRLSGQTISLADSNYQAFASVLDNEVMGVAKDLAKELNFQVFGDGSGTRATITAAVTSTTFTCAGGTRYLFIGQVVDIIDGSTIANVDPTVKAAGRTITALTATTVTVSGANVAVVNTDRIVRAGSVVREWTGLDRMISATGTYQNIDPTTEPAWAAHVNANGGTNRALNEALMISTIDVPRQNGAKVSVGFYGLGVRRAYFNVLQSQRQFIGSKDFEGGFTGLAFVTDQGEIPMVVDVDARSNRIYFLDESEVKLYRDKDWSWMDRDGSKWTKVTNVGGTAGNYDAYEATMYQYSELGTHRRNAHAILADITEA
jgi:hypothetical protein